MMTEMEISKEEFQGEIQRFPRKQDEGEQSSCPHCPLRLAAQRGDAGCVERSALGGPQRLKTEK